jgi:hypothetical protein
LYIEEAGALSRKGHVHLQSTCAVMPSRIRTVMAHRDSIYRLENLIEFDDALVGGRFLLRHVKPGQVLRTDAFPALNVVAKGHGHEKKVTPPRETAEWLPLVHRAIGNLKIFLNGTFHGVTRQYLQEYVDGL